MSTIPNEVPADTLPRPGLWEWVRAHQRAILFGTIAFQMVVLGSMIARSTWTLITGETILLHVIPVDPRDLFRGDYVILAYDFTTRRPLGDSDPRDANADQAVHTDRPLEKQRTGPQLDVDVSSTDGRSR